MKMEMEMKNWIKTVCFLLWTCVMCTACIDDDVEEGTVDLQTGESIPVFSVVMDEVKMVVEGVYSAKAAIALAKKYHVDMPIIEQVNEVLFENKPAKDAVKELMLRDKKVEHDDLEWQ